MTAFIVRRILQAIVIVIIVSIMVFLMLRILPGDPMLLYLSKGQAMSMSKEQIEVTRKEYGLDKPMHIQYISWMAGAIRADLGKSVMHRKGVTHLIIQRMPVSLYLGVISFILGNLIGIILGVISAIRRGRGMDFVVTLLANIGITIPIFWLGILFIYILGLKLGWLPIHGYTSPFKDFVMSTKQMIMPVICLCVFTVGAVARQTRSSMLEVIRQDYIRTAWAKGLKERTVVVRHVLKNGLIPVITLAGMQVPNIFGGSVLIETVFNIPGMGRLAVDAVQSLDYSVVQGIILIIAIMVVITNFVVDIAYGWLDPRIRYH